jgi:hypothetical protein
MDDPEVEAGADAEHPLYVRDSPGPRTFGDYADIALKVVTLVYTAIVAWETLKIICPPLKVHEDIALARIRQWWAAPRPRSIHVPAAWVRELYDDTR